MLKYCPNCYEEFETDEEKCPQCQTKLQEPFDDKEDAEFMELLFGHMKG